jgi:Transposase DDE domain
MFRDEHKATVWNKVRQQDLRSFDKWLTRDVFILAAARASLQEARCFRQNPLCLVNLVWLGVAAALHTEDNFGEVLTRGLRQLQNHEGSPFSHKQPNNKRSLPEKRKKHDPRTESDTVTEEAFAQARKGMPPSFWVALICLLVEQFQAEHSNLVRQYGFRLLAMDGTTIDLPNSARNREHFGTARNGRGAHGPQARMTLLQFPLVRLPCEYELGPLSTGEITMAGRLVDSAVRADDLILFDAGYWSYGLMWKIEQKQAYFAIRLRRGLNWKTLKKLGANDELREWAPKDSRRKWKDLPRSIELRVISYQVPGFRSTSIVTNVRDPQRLSREDWVRLTMEVDPKRRLLPGLYHRRLEIETTFRELKVEQGMGRLRSRTPESVAYEVAGHVLLYLMVRWMIVEAADKHQLNPLELSFLSALRAVIQMLPCLLYATPKWAKQKLLPELLDQIASHQIPYRPGRHYTRKKGRHKKKRRQARKTKAPRARKRPHRPAKGHKSTAQA